MGEGKGPEEWVGVEFVGGLGGLWCAVVGRPARLGVALVVVKEGGTP